MTALSATCSLPDERHENPLSALAEAMPALVFVTDADGWIVQANRRFHQYAGWDGDDVAGGTWLSFVHAHDRSRALAAWNAARDARHAFELQVRLVHAAGRCGAFDCRAVPVYLDGDVDRWTFAAVTTHDQPAAPAPEPPDAWFRHAFEHSAMGLARIAPGGHFVAVNEQLCRMLGYGRAQLLGSSIQHLALEPGIAADGRGAAALLPGACYQHRVEQLWRRADGSAICVALRCDRVPAEDSTCEHFVCVVEDCSEAQAAVAELAERKAMLERFVQSAPVALALFDGDMRYLAHSGCYPAEIGMPAGESLVGRSHYEVLPDVPRRWRQIHERVLQGHEHCGEAEPFHRPDGSTDWVRWAMRPWRRRSSAIGGAVLFFEVVTAQVLAARAQQDALQRLRHGEVQARRTAERLTQILHSLPDPVWARDLDGRWTLVNAAAAQLPAPVRDACAVHPVRDEDARVLHEGATVQARIEHFDAVRGEPQVWLSTRLPLRSSEGHVTGLLGVAHDITEGCQARRDGLCSNQDNGGGRQEETAASKARNTASTQGLHGNDAPVSPSHLAPLDGCDQGGMPTP